MGDMQELEGGELEVGIVVNTVLTHKILQNVSTHIGQLTPAYNSSSGGSHTLFWPLGHWHSCVLTPTQSHT